MKRKALSKSIIEYFFIFLLFVLFIIGCWVCGFNIGLAAIFVAILLAILREFALLKSLRGLTITILSVALIITMYHIDIDRRRITEKDKILFLLGGNLGICSFENTYNPPEGLAASSCFQPAITAILESIKYPQNKKNEFITDFFLNLKEAKALDILHKPSDKAFQEWIGILSEQVKIEKPLTDFIKTKYGIKGYVIFKLAKNIPHLRLVLVMNLDKEEAQRRSLAPSGLPDYVILPETEVIIYNFKKMATFFVKKHFPDELNKSINFIATANIADSNDRKQMLEEIVKIGYIFDQPIPK